MEALLASRNYVFQRVLGSGSCGTAFLCTHQNHGQVVVKQVRILETTSQQEAETEVKVMQKMDHLNICHYIDCFKLEGSLFIVMEYCERGELADLIANRASTRQPFTEQEIMFMLTQIALALFHVHSKNILHRDLKSSNVFICTGNILKLGDFGIARVLTSNTDLAKTAIGTPFYLSPEICQDKPYNRKSDVWALGCLLYEMSALHRAFEGSSLPALVVKILRGRYPPLPARYSSQLRALVDAMLQQDPRARPSIDEILRTDYVKQHLARYAQHVMGLARQPSAGNRHFPWLHNADGSRAAAPDAATSPGTATSSFSISDEPSGGIEQHPVAAAAADTAATGAAVVGVNEYAVGAEGVNHNQHKNADNKQQEMSAAAAAASTGPPDCLLSSSELHNTGSSSASNSIDENSSSLNSSLGGTSNSCKSDTSAADTNQEQEHKQEEQQQHHGRGLVGTCWLEKQHAAFAQLQMEMAASPVFGGARPLAAAGVLHAASEACAVTLNAQDNLPEQRQIGQQQGLQQQPPLPDAKVPAITPVPRPDAAVQHRVSNSTPTQNSSSSSSSKQTSKGGRSGSIKRRPTKHAASPAGSVAAARASRQAEKRAWQQHQAKAAAQDAARRAARAAELEAAIKDKQEQQRRQQQEGAEAAAVHRQHMRQVQTRVGKAHLAALGAAFKQRLEAEFVAAAAGDDTAAAALLLVPLDSTCVAQDAAVGSQQQCRSRNRHHSDNSSKVSSASGSVAASQCSMPERARAGDTSTSALSAQATPPATATEAAEEKGKEDVAGLARAGSHPAATVMGTAAPPVHDSAMNTKPWRRLPGACRGHDKTKDSKPAEPAVEIFCPFGSCVEEPEEQQLQKHLHELTFACNLGHCQSAAAVNSSSTAGEESNRMQHILFQINGVFQGGLELPPEDPGSLIQQQQQQQRSWPQQQQQQQQQQPSPQQQP